MLSTRRTIQALAAVILLEAALGAAFYAHASTAAPMQATPAPSALPYDLVTLERDEGGAVNVYVIDYALSASDCDSELAALSPQVWRVAAACYTPAETNEIIRRLPKA